MKTVGAVLLLGMLVGARAVALPPQLMHLHPCDSPEVEEAAVAAVDYINGLQKHGYKYALARVEKAEVSSASTGGEVFLLELDLLQTNCHVLDPTPLANCTVITRNEMRIEGDCDVVVKKADGMLSVIAFKCKSEPDSLEHLCVGCPILLPLNHTEALQMVNVSLLGINKQSNTTTFGLLEVARLTSQVVGGGVKLKAEYVMVETNCTHGSCVPLQGPQTNYGVCEASSHIQLSTTTCKVFHIRPSPVTIATNGTGEAARLAPPVPGLLHHKMIGHHNLKATGLLSESNESGEVPVVKRDAPADPGQPEAALPVASSTGSPICPGRPKFH